MEFAKSREEMGKSLAEGFVSTWDVAAEYEVADGVLRRTDWRGGFENPLPWDRQYRPGAYPQLVAEFARLNVNEPAQLISFAKTWGALGFLEQILSLPVVLPGETEKQIEYLKAVGGDPLSWIAAHVQGVNVCLRLIDCLLRRDYREIESYLKAFRPTLSFVEAGLEPSTDISILYGRRYQTVSSWFSAPDPESYNPPYSEQEQSFMLAKNVIEGIVNDNLRGGIAPALKHGWETGFGELFEFVSLMDVIYWHLMRIATSKVGLAKCQECGQYFIQTHGRQRFCPPEDWEGEQAESRCARRYRARKARKKKRGG